MNNETRKAIHSRLEKIRARNAGLLRPDDVVKDARSESSPLHSLFEWDNSKAAHQHRLYQARDLIASVRVEVTTSTRVMAVPYYARDPNIASDEQGYSPIASFRDERQSSEEILRYEFDRAVALLERAVGIAESLNIEDSFVELLRRARVIRESLLSAPVRESPSAKPARKGRKAVEV